MQGFLAPGVTRPAAAANLDALAATLRARYPVDNHDLQMRVIPERETRPIIDAAAVVAPAATFIMAVALVGLAIDGASVTSLFLARSLTRQREIAIRLAMGASTGRLFRQLLFESLIVASLGACVGFLVASWLLSAFSSATLPGSMMVDVRPDRTVAFFAIVLAVVTGVATGTWPARRAARADYQQALRDGANSTPARAEGKARSRLVVSQFSALTVLLILLAVFAGAARTQARVDLGFDPAQRLLLTLSPEELGYDMPAARSVDPIVSRSRPAVCRACRRRPPPTSRRSIGAAVRCNSDRPRLSRCCSRSHCLHCRHAELLRDDRHTNPSRAIVRRRRPGGIAAGRRDQRHVGQNVVASG